MAYGIRFAWARRAVLLLPAMSACFSEGQLHPDGGPLPPVAPLFVAVGPSGRIVTSPDGSVWTPRASGVDAVLDAVAAGASRFVVVGDGGTVLTSRDGVGWTRAASPTTRDLWRVIFTGDRFVAVGGDWTDGAVTLTSADGESWSVMPSPSNYMFHSVVHGGGNLVAAACYRSDLLTPAQFHSSAGGAWTMHAGADFPDFYAGLSAGGLMVVVGGSIAISPDNGASWETTLPAWVNVHGVAFGGGTFAVVGELGRLYSSPDAREWTERASPLGMQGSFYSVAYGGGRFVAVGSPGHVLTSADGVSWEAGATGVGELLSGISFGPL